MGIGDRFGRQGEAQLAAMDAAARSGVTVAPVWNKSHREHTIIGTAPDAVRAEADAAVAALNWTGNYYVDADHIGLDNVDRFITSSDFFTLDVADATGEPAPEEDVTAFCERYRKRVGDLAVDGLDAPLPVTEARMADAARKYLLAVREAGRIYRHIRKQRGDDDFVTEVSMDETDSAQDPIEMLFILAAIAEEGIPAQTIAPKFTGRFNKGVDYVGDLDRFRQEFEQDLAVIRFAVTEFGLPQNLKLSVHSGSDKFSLYPVIRRAIRKFDTGLHLKTAGTTWLEEVAGLALAGGKGLEMAKAIYSASLDRFGELCGPYASVIDIDTANLPAADVVAGWDGPTFAAALQHDRTCDRYNPDLRQLIHVGYKVAAEMGDRYLDDLEACADVIAENVTTNLLDRHMRPLFMEND